MKTIDLDLGQEQQLAEKLGVRREHLDTIRRGGLHALGEGRDCPPLHLGHWAGADLWDRGVISEDEARYLDTVKAGRARMKIEGWLKAWSAGDKPASFPGEVEQRFAHEVAVKFADVCSALLAETEKAKLFLVEVIESLQSRDREFRYETRTRNSRLPKRLIIDFSEAAENR